MSLLLKLAGAGCIAGLVNGGWMTLHQLGTRDLRGAIRAEALIFVLIVLGVVSGMVVGERVVNPADAYSVGMYVAFPAGLAVGMLCGGSIAYRLVHRANAGADADTR